MQVAELGSFTKAAEALGYSQSTVSFQIKQLEESLGVQLLKESTILCASLTRAARSSPFRINS